jgi:hypothetical protein
LKEAIAAWEALVTSLNPAALLLAAAERRLERAKALLRSALGGGNDQLEKALAGGLPKCSAPMQRQGSGEHCAAAMARSSQKVVPIWRPWARPCTSWTNPR